MIIPDIIKYALSEDIGNGDHTTLSTIPENAMGISRMLVKEDGVISGVEIAKEVFLQVDKNLKITTFINDGKKIKVGDIIFQVEGSSRSMLIAERTALNFIQRMSGIATHTNQIVEKLKGYKTKVLDTRKTTPLLRELEKQAVRDGGGLNHRIGLYDMILIKDNHIDFAGGISQAILSCNNYIKQRNLKIAIEIETRNLSEVSEVLSIGGVNRIMLDNFSFPDLREAVKMIDGKYETEASGGININTVQSFAECGVDFVSIGALTHHIKSLDISLEAI